MNDKPRVAFIGLGRMGGPMSDHLPAAGFDVAVYDVAPAAMEARVERGARAATSPADAARDADVVSIVVFDADQAREVLAGPDGLLATLAPGAVVCVHTTVSLDAIRELAATAEPHGVTVLDAGISGGEPGAAKGSLLTMVGGPADALERARPVLDAYSKAVLHAGPLGTGMALKLARNATSFAFMAVVHEALVLADAAGVELAMLRQALETTGLFEQSLTPITLGPPVPLADDAPAAFRSTLEHAVAMADKDLDQAIRLAADLGVPSDLFAHTRANFAPVMRVG